MNGARGEHTCSRLLSLYLSKWDFVYFKVWLDTDVGWSERQQSARYFRSVAAPAARNAASAPPRVAGAERAARSVINKGGARLRARAPSRAFLTLGSLTRARPPLLPPPTLPKTTILGSPIALVAPRPQAWPRSIPMSMPIVVITARENLWVLSDSSTSFYLSRLRGCWPLGLHLAS